MVENYDIQALAAEVSTAVQRYPDDRERVEAIKPMVARWMERQEGLLPQHRLPCEGERACGHLLHTADDGSFFIISVVFPPGTSSGVHYHGAWAVIGGLGGEDEERKNARPGGPRVFGPAQPCEVEKTGPFHF